MMSMCTSSTREQFVDAREARKKCCKKVSMGTSQEANFNDHMVVRRVQLPCTHKYSTGRMREGFADLTLRRAGRGAHCTFNDLSSVSELQWEPAL